MDQRGRKTRQVLVFFPQVFIGFKLEQFRLNKIQTSQLSIPVSVLQDWIIPTLHPCFVSLRFDYHLNGT